MSQLRGSGMGRTAQDDILEARLGTLRAEEQKVKEPIVQIGTPSNQVKRVAPHYFGEAKAYVPKDVENPAYDALKKLAYVSEDLEQKLQQESVDVAARHSKQTSSQGYFEHVAGKHMVSDDAEMFKSYLQSKGRVPYQITGITTSRIGSELAHVKLTEYGDSATAVLSGSPDFKKEASKSAVQYGVPVELMEKYAVFHELAHAWGQRGQRFDDTITKEKDVESLLMGYFSEMSAQHPERATEYQALAKIAEHRYQSVHQNYGAGTFTIPNGPEDLSDVIRGSAYDSGTSTNPTETIVISATGSTNYKSPKGGVAYTGSAAPKNYSVSVSSSTSAVSSCSRGVASSVSVSSSGCSSKS